MTCSLWENCVVSCSGPIHFLKTVLIFFMQRMHESGVNLNGEGEMFVSVLLKDHLSIKLTSLYLWPCQYFVSRKSS